MKCTNCSASLEDPVHVRWYKGPSGNNAYCVDCYINDDGQTPQPTQWFSSLAITDHETRYVARQITLQTILNMHQRQRMDEVLGIAHDDDAGNVAAPVVVDEGEMLHTSSDESDGERDDPCRVLRGAPLTASIGIDTLIKRNKPIVIVIE